MELYKGYSNAYNHTIKIILGQEVDDLMGKIVVMGSLNMDMVLTTERLPRIGETIHGEHIYYMMGGKGANQAVAASRMGIPTALIGCVGNDTFGEKMRKHLAEENEHLDVSSVTTVDGVFTGIATVFKTNKDNAIVVIPGANDCCDQAVVDEHLDVIKQADVLLVQLETPLDTVAYALKKAKALGLKTILNPAPYKALSSEMLAYADYLTPNETEFESLTGRKFDSPEQLEAAMLAWSNDHAGVNLIVTRGSKGSSYVAHGAVHTVPSIQVEVVDTTGAGDTFNGILAYAIAENKPLGDAVKLAGIGASLSITGLGAQTGMPSLEKIQPYL